MIVSKKTFNSIIFIHTNTIIRIKIPLYWIVAVSHTKQKVIFYDFHRFHPKHKHFSLSPLKNCVKMCNIIRFVDTACGLSRTPAINNIPHNFIHPNKPESNKRRQ